MRVAGESETTAHERNRECQGCHPQAAHCSSTRFRGSSGLIAIRPARESTPGTGLLKLRMPTKMKSAVRRSIFF
jgi:hypothetical protein